MRVMTYNIRGGLGMDGRRSMERVAEVIAGQGADVVCLQEVHQRLPQSGFGDQPGQLAGRLGMTVTFQANLRIGLGGYGLAVATARPPAAVQNHKLPSVREQRGVLQLSLETPAGLVAVFCTHFGLSGAERVTQAERLAELALAVPGPVVVCGDFNERPDAPAVRRLLDQTGLLDADAAQGRPTYPADAPAARIDYVFHSPGLACRAVSVIDTPASDHMPLVTEFQQ